MSGGKELRMSETNGRVAMMNVERVLFVFKKSARGSGIWVGLEHLLRDVLFGKGKIG